MGLLGVDETGWHAALNRVFPQGAIGGQVSRGSAASNVAHTCLQTPSPPLKYGQPQETRSPSRSWIKLNMYVRVPVTTALTSVEPPRISFTAPTSSYYEV